MSELTITIDGVSYTYAAPPGAVVQMAIQKCLHHDWMPWEVSVETGGVPVTSLHEFRQCLRDARKDRRELGIV